MFAYRIPAPDCADMPAVDARIPDTAGERFAYWRKHSDLHVWMWSRYKLKGGREADFREFNMVTVEVTTEDLDRLSECLAMWELLGDAEPFFYNTTAEQAETDERFIENARQHIANGERIFYDSWC